MREVDVLAVMERAAVDELPLMSAADMKVARTAVAEPIEAAEAVARIQINRRSPANDLGKAKQVRLRAALPRVRGAE